MTTQFLLLSLTSGNKEKHIQFPFLGPLGTFTFCLHLKLYLNLGSFVLKAISDLHTDLFLRGMPSTRNKLHLNSVHCTVQYCTFCPHFCWSGYAVYKTH